MSRLPVHITFDLDPDGATADATDRSILSWNGVELLPRIHDELIDRGIRYTAFVRCDQQIFDLYGDPLWVYGKLRRTLDGARAVGCEIGWHPHLDAKSGSSYSPIRMPETACAVVRSVFSQVSSLGFRSVRIGEAWHDPALMRELDQLGLAIDSTAIPGRRRVDERRSIDWEPTPNRPYHPGGQDHRVESSESALRIIEVPMTTAPIRTAYDSVPTRRYLNLAFQPSMFAFGLDHYIEGRNGLRDALVLVFHPDELLPGRANELYARDWSALASNLDYLDRALRAANVDYAYRTLSEEWS